MAYVTPDDENLLEDIAARLEFRMLTPVKDIAPFWQDAVPISMTTNMITKGERLSFHSYQLFVQEFMNPNTQYKRLLLNHGTGMGKTLSASGIALKFIDYYRQMEAMSAEQDVPFGGSVFVVGFAEAVFHRDLMRFPELKFITLDERIQLNELRAQAFRTGSKQIAERIKDLETKIKRRFNNRQNNGFFTFIGYRAFFNRLFVPAATTSGHKGNLGRMELGKLSEEEILKLIREKKIIVNKAMLARMENSLLICDEVHKIYNTIEKNNWGVAIQYVLDHVPSVRALFLSATPINNSPAEIIDLMKAFSLP